MILIQDISVVCNPLCEINAIGWMPGAACNRRLDTALGPSLDHAGNKSRTKGFGVFRRNWPAKDGDPDISAPNTLANRSKSKEA